jgi:hypothetical protein
LKIVVIAENDWNKVSDLLFIGNKYAPEIVGVETAWTWPFTVCFRSVSDADVFIALAKEADVNVLIDF